MHKRERSNIVKIILPMSSAVKVKRPATHYINQAYVAYMLEAGLQPVLACPGMNLDALVKEADGLVLPGGIDLDPIYYGNNNNSSLMVDPEKDAFERELFHRVRELGKPTFGICRGFQLIVQEFRTHHDLLDYRYVYLEQHLDFHNQTTDQKLARNVHMHFVHVQTGGLYTLAEDARERIPINSMHHQCVITDLLTSEATLKKGGFHIVGYTTLGLKKTKGRKFVVVEAVKITDWGGPILAVQWHPEELRDIRLIRNFFGSVEKVKEKAEHGVDQCTNTQKAKRAKSGSGSAGA